MNIGDVYIHNRLGFAVKIVKLDHTDKRAEVHYNVILSVDDHSMHYNLHDEYYWSIKNFNKKYIFSQKLTNEQMIKDIIE